MGVVAHEIVEPLPHLDRGRAIESEGDDAFRGRAQDPQQIGDAMHDDRGLAGPGPRQDQVVAGLARLHQPLLHGIAQCLHDAAIRLGRGGELEQFFATGEVRRDEAIAPPGKICRHQGERIGDLPGTAARELIDDVDLEVPFLVMALERGVILPGESTGPRHKLDRHGRAKHRAAPVQDQDLGPMQVK